MVILNNLATVYERENNFELAEKYYLLALEIDSAQNSSTIISTEALQITNVHRAASCNLAKLYTKFNKYELAEKYYLLSISKGNTEALHDLGLFYNYIIKNNKLAEEYYLKAIENNIPVTMLKLGTLYYKEENNFELCVYYFKIASEKGYQHGYWNLGKTFEINIDIETAISYFKLGFKLNCESCFDELFEIYLF